MKDAEIKPMINQVEYHPRLTQKELQAFCKEQGYSNGSMVTTYARTIIR